MIDMAKRFVTMAEACQILNISQRTLHRRIREGLIESKKEGKRRLVLVDDSHIAASDTHMAEADMPLMEYLREENAYLRQKLDEATKLLDSASERRETIVLQLKRQVDEAKRLLEDRGSWWKKIWRRRRDAKDKD